MSPPRFYLTHIPTRLTFAGRRVTWSQARPAAHSLLICLTNLSTVLTGQETPQIGGRPEGDLQLFGVTVDYYGFTKRDVEPKYDSVQFDSVRNAEGFAPDSFSSSSCWGFVLLELLPVGDSFCWTSC